MCIQEPVIARTDSSSNRAHRDNRSRFQSSWGDIQGRTEQHIDGLDFHTLLDPKCIVRLRDFATQFSNEQSQAGLTCGQTLFFFRTNTANEEGKGCYSYMILLS